MDKLARLLVRLWLLNLNGLRFLVAIWAWAIIRNSAAINSDDGGTGRKVIVPCTYDSNNHIK